MNWCFDYSWQQRATSFTNRLHDYIAYTALKSHTHSFHLPNKPDITLPTWEFVDIASNTGVCLYNMCACVHAHKTDLLHSNTVLNNLPISNYTPWQTRQKVLTCCHKKACLHWEEDCSTGLSGTEVCCHAALSLPSSWPSVSPSHEDPLASLLWYSQHFPIKESNKEGRDKNKGEFESQLRRLTVGIP